MKTEFEVKVLGIDVPKVQAILEGLGAVKIAEKSMRRLVYDIENTSVSCRSWIRLRDDGEKVTLTYKKIDSHTVGGTKEIEFDVGDFEMADAFLQKLGFPPAAYQENRRIHYSLDGAEVDIDFWPKIPPYLEIEAGSAEKVSELVSRLGFSQDEVTAIGVGEVFEKYGFNIHDFKELKF